MIVNNTDRSLHRRISSANSNMQEFENNNKSAKAICDKSKKYFKLFLNTSSIHGLNHMVAPGRHPLEVLLWLTTVGFSIFGATYLSQITWTRYQSSPTVVSMDRDMYAWNTTFPCVTVCPTIKLDMELVEEYVKNSEEPNKELLRNFIKELANANYKTFAKIPEYTKISPEDYMPLILNLTLPFKPILTVGVSGIVLNVVPTITEMGLCYAVNSRVATYNSPEYRDANRWDLLTKHNRTLYIHPLDGEVFAQVVNLSTGYDVYIHGPQEFPDISMKYEHSDKNYYLKLYVTAVTVYTSKEAAQLSVSQRRCRFPYENNLKHNSIYTYNLCRMECRIRLCLEYCKCIPHFYRRIVSFVSVAFRWFVNQTTEGLTMDTGNEKICDVQGLKCLANFKEDLYKLRSNQTGEKLNCDCYPLCDDVNYVLQSNILQQWFLGTNLQWGMVTYPRMRYRRAIIFGFTDVLVAVGGMAGLFLGCSVLSFMEIVYFMTLRLVCYARNPKTTK